MEASSSSCETRQAPSTSSSSDSHAHHLPSSAEPRQQPLDKMGQDEVMTDDMKLAISALGLLRSEGGGGASSHPPTPHHSQTSQFPNHSPTLSSHQYRSTSTASTSGASDQWGTNTNSSLVSGSETGTGTSSPLTTTSIAHSDQGDYFKRPGIEGEYELEEGNEHDPKFIERVSQLPLVSGGLEWYERSKANSRVVKYGAGLVESSFSAVSRPITNNLQLGPLDDFACRQLDRIGAPTRGQTSPGRKDVEALQFGEEEREERERTPPSHSSHPGGGDEHMQGSQDGRGSPPGSQVAVQHGQRSRWQTVLVEAGGLGAAVSEESLKSLRYCLQWLVYATAHLDHQISTLREFILSLRVHNRTHPSNSSSSASQQASSNALVAASASAHLSQIKHDVVETIRKVVEVVSKYAGAALPEQAKRYVKQSIMGLPVKWASAIEGRGTSERMERQGSEIETPRIERMGETYFNGSSSSGADGRNREDREREEAEREVRAALGPTEDAADRVLTFAVESLDMLRSVASIFGESVEKAEAWIERLRIVGLQRQRQRQEQEQHQPLTLGAPDSPQYPPSLSASAAFDPNTATGGMKRRRGAAHGRHGSVADGGVEGENGTNAGGEGGEGFTDGEEMAASARRKRGARGREMSASSS